MPLTYSTKIECAKKAIAINNATNTPTLSKQLRTKHKMSSKKLLNFLM